MVVWLHLPKYFILRQFYRAPEEDAPPISPSYSLPSSSFSPSNPEGQAILTDQEWQQTDNTFKPIFRDGTPLEKSNRKPEQQESLVTTDSPAGEKPWNTQHLSLIPRLSVCTSVLPNKATLCCLSCRPENPITSSKRPLDSR